MPKIPEAKFNKTPSTRVGAQKVAAPQPTGFDNALKTAQGLTHAMAKLQDQRERTDAFNAATDARRGYEQEKSKLLTAMQNMDDQGNYKYIDPLSTPDKPNVIQGNIHEELGKLNTSFTKTQTDLGNLERSDIAMDLHQQYVGDDLVKMRVKAGKQIFKQKKAKLTEGTLNVIELGMTNVMDAATQGGNPELIQANVISEINRIDRSIAQSGQMLGKDEVEKLTTFRDKMLRQTADNLIQTKMDGNTIATADKLLSKIKDPYMKKSKEMYLEKIKESKGRSHDKTWATNVSRVGNTLKSTERIDDETMLKTVQSIKNLRAAYYDPKYSGIKPEQRESALLNLESQVFSKYFKQEAVISSEQDLQLIEQIAIEQGKLSMLGNKIEAEGREPSAIEKREIDAGTSKVVDLENQIFDLMDRSLASSGIVDRKLSKEDKLQMFQLAKADLAQNYESLGRLLPEQFAAKYPSQPINERVAGIDAKAETMGVSDIAYATADEHKGFTTAFKGFLKENRPDVAYSQLSEQVATLGPEHTRAFAQDLVRGDKKLGYVVAAADFMGIGNNVVADEIIRDAHQVAASEKVFMNKDGTSKLASDSTIENALVSQAEDWGLDLAFQQTDSYRSSMKDAFMNRVKIELMEKPGKISIKDAVTKTLNYFDDHVYASKNNDVGNVIITRPPNVRDFEAYRGKVMNGAAHFQRTLPGVSTEDMRYIMENYVKDPSAQVGTESTLKLAAKYSLRLDPHPRRPNTYMVTWKGKPVTRKDRTEIIYTADEMSMAIDDRAFNKEDIENADWFKGK